VFFAFADDGEDVAFFGDNLSSVFVLDDHFPGEDFQANNFSLSDFRDDHCSDCGEFAAVFLIGVMFVAEAAFESSAATRNFGWVEGCLLKFCHLHGDGRHLPQVSVAADGFTTVSVVGEEFGFVPYADLSHFDAGVELLGEGFDEIPEIDAVFSEVIKDESFFPEEMLGVDKLHLEFVLFDELLTAEKLVPFLAVQMTACSVIVRGGLTEDGSIFLL